MLHLETALALEVEPLDYCAHRFGLGNELVVERAAAWAGLTFAPRIPDAAPRRLTIDRIERLGEVRTIRRELTNDRRVVYSAPRFSDFLRLRKVAWDPTFRRHFCIVPEAAIREELAKAGEEELLREARQRLARAWPNATGGVSATKGRRVTFAVAIVLLMLFTLLAPTLSEAGFLPVVAALLLVPAAMRLWAAISRTAPVAAPDPLNDADLPTYSILVPLRDEAHMVPQLALAMRDIDYPALCSKSTNFPHA